MYHIIIRFYEELNYFLPDHMQKCDTQFSFCDKRSVKDLIESFAVPHVEVDMILVNGDAVDFTYLVKDGDRISVYPVFETFAIDKVSKLAQSPLRETRFVLDVHLGKLARKLRFLGFDVDFATHRDDPQLAQISNQQQRILLTRDRQLLMRKQVTRGLFIRNTDPRKQIMEVLHRLDLHSQCRPFTRCVNCNGSIVPLNCEKNRRLVLEQVPPKVQKWCTEYSHCQTCGKIYWKGSHYRELLSLAEKLC